MDLHLAPVMVERAPDRWPEAVSFALSPCSGTVIRGQRVHCARRWTKAEALAHEICPACYARMAVLHDVAWRTFLRSAMAVA
jgi:hypothetical protein